MRLTFFGAAHEVTGSCHLLETKNKKILFDCGMFQGSDFNEGKNADKFPFDPKTIDVLLVSHAHLDHTGRIPKLIKDGFTGPIYMTKATAEFAKLIWEDAYQIMKYNHRKFQKPILFDTSDITKTMKQCKGVDYREKIDLGGGCSAIFKDAGHIFGAAFIEVEADGKIVCHSGDIGNVNVPILRETEQLGKIDVLLCESTYGDRLHETEKKRKQLLLDLVNEGVKRGGTIMMPAFSLERTQEILYQLDELIEKDKSLPSFPIFLDGPLAIKATPIYKKYTEYYDKKAMEKMKAGNDFLDFPQLILTETKEESKKINNVHGPKMIIAGAGMMNGGRILHHAHRYLSDPASTLIFVGYQAQGTLGRKLYEGTKQVKVFGDRIKVKCAIKAIGALSAHGDQKKLLQWIANAKKIPDQVFCVHGEPHAATELAHRLRDDLKIEAFVPEEGESVQI